MSEKQGLPATHDLDLLALMGITVGCPQAIALPQKTLAFLSRVWDLHLLSLSFWSLEVKTLRKKVFPSSLPQKRFLLKQQAVSQCGPGEWEVSVPRQTHPGQCPEL